MSPWGNTYHVRKFIVLINPWLNLYVKKLENIIGIEDKMDSRRQLMNEMVDRNFMVGD